MYCFVRFKSQKNSPILKSLWFLYHDVTHDFLIGITMFGANLNHSYVCRITVILIHWKMIVFKLLFSHQKIVYVIGSSSKRASELSQKRLSIFCQKAQSFVYFVSCDFLQISPACGSNTKKSNFAVNMQLKHFRATVANANSESLKSLPHNLVRIWITCWRNLNQIVHSKIYKIWAFGQKHRDLLKPFSTKRSRLL